MVDTTRILKLTDIDILSSTSSRASASNVYTNQEITQVDITVANALKNKSDKTNTYLKTKVDVVLSIVQAGILKAF